MKGKTLYNVTHYGGLAVAFALIYALPDVNGWWFSLPYIALATGLMIGSISGQMEARDRRQQ